MTTNDHIAETKQFRKDLDAVLSTLRLANGGVVGAVARDFHQIRQSRPRSIAITKLQEAIMWLGMDLKAINEETPGSCENPYPQSYNPESPNIEPTADGLKL